MPKVQRRELEGDDIVREVGCVSMKHKIDSTKLQKAPADRACVTKYGFPNKQSAERSIHKAYMNAYRCRHCGLWHVGGH